MTLALFLILLLQTQAPADSAPKPALRVQLGVRITPDTVTVGQRFIVVVRVKAPRGAIIEFPQSADSADSALVTGTQVTGKPVVQALADSTGTTMSAAYRLAAWDVGVQRLPLNDIVVKSGSQTGYVSLAGRTFFVRSVLPADSALRVPKPPRPPIDITPFDWIPLALAALAIAAAALLWRIFIWYRRRRNRPLDAFSEAEQEFNRIEALRLLESGEGERHVALMSDVMREYMAARVPGVSRSQTSSELISAADSVQSVAHGMGELLWRADLAKFAGLRIDSDEAGRLGAAARSIVRSVEMHLIEQARRDQRLEKAA